MKEHGELDGARSLHGQVSVYSGELSRIELMGKKSDFTVMGGDNRLQFAT